MFSKKQAVIPSTENNLLVASRDGDLAQVESIVKKFEGPDLINVGNIAGNTPLHLAVMKGHVDVAAFLINNGASMNRLNNYSMNPFYKACFHVQLYVDGEKPSQLLHAFEEILKIFLANGFDLNDTERKSKSYLGELALAGALGAMKVLVRYGANIEIRDQFGFTPLHCAAIKGHFHKEQLDVAKWLIDIDAKTRVYTDAGQTPLDLAMQSDYPDMYELIDRYCAKADFRP